MADQNYNGDPFRQYGNGDFFHQNNGGQGGGGNPFAQSNSGNPLFQDAVPTIPVDNSIGSNSFAPTVGAQQEDLFGGYDVTQPITSGQGGGGSHRGGGGSGGGSVKLVLITVIAVLLVVGIVIGVLLIIQNKKTEDETTTASQAVETTVAAVQPTETVTAAETTQPAMPETAATSAPPPVTQEPATAPSSAPNAQYNYPPPTVVRAETKAGEVLASSNVNSARSFGADQAIDGYANTCWCVNTNSPGGAGGALTIYLKEYSTVSGIAIINGNTFQPEENVYRSNGQVRNFTLTFSDGTSVSYQASFNNATSQFETFRFSTPIATDRITLRVDSGYPGEKYTENVCIGEISVF